jgi:ribose-phosphate pyrophosphokinase
VIKELVVLDTITLSDEMKELDNITLLSVAPIFAESIRRIFNNDSVSKLFD